MAKKQIWTGSKGQFTLTIGNICNHEHVVGHNTVVQGEGGTHESLEGLVIWNPAGNKAAGHSYYDLTTTGSSMVVNNKDAFVEFDDNAESYNSVIFETQTYMIGASGALTWSDKHVSEAIEIYKTNSIVGNLTYATEMWTMSDITSETEQTITWNSLGNAYDTKATITSSTGALTVTSGAKESGNLKATANNSFTSFDATGKATAVVTIDLADGAVAVTNPEYVRSKNTSTITVYNTADTVTVDDIVFFLNTGTNAGDVGGYFHTSASVSNSVNKQSVHVPSSYWTLEQTTGLISTDLVGTHNNNANVKVQAIAGTTGVKTGVSKIDIVACDGKVSTAKETMQITITNPTFSGLDMSVGETAKEALTMSSLATHTSVVRVESDDTSIVTITNKIPHAVGTGEAHLTWYTSDNAILHTGVITVGAAVKLAILKSDKVSVASDANYGDTLFVKITGGKTGETFTLTTSAGTLSDYEGVKTDDWVVLTLPATGPNNDEITVTATPDSGATGATANTVAKHITFTLS